MGFGLGIGCGADWYGYTGGLPGYNTSAFYFPPQKITIIAWTTLQADNPAPGIANTIFAEIVAIMTPQNKPLAELIATAAAPSDAKAGRN